MPTTVPITPTQALALVTASNALVKANACYAELSSTIDSKRASLANTLAWHNNNLIAAQAAAAAAQSTWVALVQAAISDPTSTVLTVDPVGNTITTDLLANVAATNVPTNVPLAKANACAAIDARSEALIANGFVFNGVTFSLSASAQVKWLGLAVGATGMTFPYVVSNIDDSATFSIPDAPTVEQMFGAAMTTIAGILAAGVALKTQVNAAVDSAGVAAVVDTR